jgi:hypothetical protein
MAESNAIASGYRDDYGPEYDAIYLQWMMAYGQATGDTYWLRLGQLNAAAAASNALGSGGLWLASWWGGPIDDPETHSNMFRTMAATTSLFAWVEVYSGQHEPGPPPAPAAPARHFRSHRGARHAHGSRRRHRGARHAHSRRRHRHSRRHAHRGARHGRGRRRRR